MIRLLALPRLRKVGHNIDRPAVIAASRLMTILLTLGTAPLVARTLGPEGRGVYAATLAALALSPVIFGIGMPVAIRRLTAAGRVDNHIRALYLLIPALCIPAALAVFPLIQFLIVHLTTAERLSFTLAMVASVLYVTTLSAQSVFIAKARYLNVAALQSIQIVIVSFLTVAFFIADSLSISALLNFYSVATLATTCLSVAMLNIPLRGPRSSSRALMKEGSKYAISQVTEASAFSLYQLLAITALGPNSAGYLAVGMTIASLPIAVAHTVGAVAFREVANSGPRYVREVVARFLRVSTLLGVGTSASLIIITPVAVPLIFGNGFEPGVPLMIGVLLGCPALIVNYVGMQMLAAVGKGFRMATAQLGGIALGILLLYALGSRSLQGLAGIGVAIGWTTTSALIMLSLPIGINLLIPRKRDFKSTWDICIRGKLPSQNPSGTNPDAASSTQPNLTPHPRHLVSTHHSAHLVTKQSAESNIRRTTMLDSALVSNRMYLLLILIFSGALIILILRSTNLFGRPH